MVQEEIIDGVDGVPVSPLLSVERRNRYGSVPGLDDEELADPDELERQVWLQEWGPILALPSKAKGSVIWPVVNEDGGVVSGSRGSAAVACDALGPIA